MRTVTEALRHFWWVLLALALAGVLAAGVLAVKRPPTYQASAVLSLDTSQSVNQGFDVALQADQFLSQRYIQMATSAPVLQRACAASPPCDPSALAKRVSATDTKGTGVIQVSVTASSPQEAARLANAVAAAIIAQNNQEVDSRIKPQRDLLEQNLKQRVEQLVDQHRGQTRAGNQTRPATPAATPV